jgi:hypothetical protein
MTSPGGAQMSTAIDLYRANSSEKSEDCALNTNS